MILEKQTEALVHQEGTSQESIGMSLDLDSAQILMQMLSKNLYSDAIGSTIRECASNALDSHRRANVDKPIVVSFKRNNENNNYEFSVEDFGIGLDADDVRNIISKYGKSTKRNSNTELGMMGLGFKAPLAYSSTFYFVCRKDGMERKYMMYEGEDTNTIDLLYEKATKEANGVKVIVPVDYYDRSTFKQKVGEQLAYFESVYFDLEDFSNDFQIIRSEHFQWSPLATDSHLHICLDNVYYPLDFAKIGIDNTIDFPVALRFSLTDGLFPTPNRESIRYTKEAKEIILSKITKLADFFVERYNEDVKDTEDIHVLMDYFSNETRYVTLFKKHLDVGELGKYASLSFNEPKLKGINILDMKKIHRNREYILGEYDVKFRVDRGKWKECKQYWDMQIYRQISKDRKTYIYDERISGHKKDYLKSISPTGWNQQTLIVKKNKPFTLGSLRKSTDYKTYVTLLSLDKVPKYLWRAAIKEFHSVVEMYTKTWENLDNMVVPQSFIDAKKKLKVKISSATGGVRKLKLQGDILGKELKALERDVYGKHSKQVSTLYKLETAHKEKRLMVYGAADDAAKMDKLFSVFSSREVGFIVFSERELKHLKQVELHNWMPIDKFMKGENKPFRRIVTAYLIRKMVDSNRYLFDRIDNMKAISTSLHDKLKSLHDYQAKNHRRGSDDMYEAMLEVAQSNNLFDGETYVIYKEVNNILEKHPFIEIMFRQFSGYGDNASLINVTIDLFKYHRQRVDWKNYNITLTEDAPLENELEEDTIEELIQE